MKHTYEEEVFIESITRLAVDINKNAVAKGFYDPPPSDGDRIVLMHCELSEAVEFIRHGNPPSDHIPDFSGLEEEMADTIIRILDFAAHKNLRIGPAILAKHAFNKTRAHRHGNKTM